MQGLIKMRTIQGVKLVSKEIPEVSFLADEDMLEAYRERIKTKYNSKEARPSLARHSLNIFKYEDGVIKGSSPFANVELASSELALPSQVLYASELSPDFFRGNYEDLGLVLRTNGDLYSPNDYNARHLYKQLDHRGIKPSKESPVLILLRGLALEEDDESTYGLVHLLTDETQIIQAPELSHLNDRKRFSRVDERGIPVFDNEGTRTFYTRRNGLGRFSLDRGLDLYSYWYRWLTDSNAFSRVAVVKNFPSGNMDEYLARLSEEGDRQNS